TASQRAYSWAKYFSEYGYYPTIITRRWDHPINKLADISKTTPEEIVHEKNDSHEVYYLPYKSNLRDNIYIRHGELKYSILRKTLTFFEITLQNWINRVIPFNNLYTFAKSLIAKEKYETLIISGNPFIQFKFG